MAFEIDSLKDALELSSSHPEGQLKTVDLEAAGIPDFRSKDTGIYENLDEYNLPDPMAVFSIEYFERNPEPFFQIAKNLYHPYAKPTIAHYFIKLLNEKGILLRDYTQGWKR
ncbi:NAD-dependent protein deacetylase sirtuin-2 [Hymenolepis weldensis]